MRVGSYEIGPGADLSDADLSGADLTGADLDLADLTGANLTGGIGQSRNEPLSCHSSDVPHETYEFQFRMRRDTALVGQILPCRCT